MTDLLGIIAAFLTTASFLPQALLVVRTKNTDGISATMYSMFTLGVFVWLIYGLMIGSLPVILANLVTFALAATILSLKLRALKDLPHRKATGLLTRV